MEDFKKIDDKLYYAKYCDKNVDNAEEIWNSIKNNRELLEWAIKPTKDKFGERELVNGLAICEDILINYACVDKEIYQKLVDLIYSNKQIARIVLNGYSNGGYSYLLMTLFNPNLKLTKEQKRFAVEEAMNKIGTTKYKKSEKKYSKELEKNGITDDITTIIDIDGSINPIGAKAKGLYINFLFSKLSDTQAHGRGEFDIRYWILKNSNWTMKEKEKLINDFWENDEAYDEILDQWGWQ